MSCPKPWPLGVIAVIVAAFVVTESTLSLGQAGRKTLDQALTAYENSSERLGASGSSLERAQSIKALSIIASPRYVKARDRWSSDASHEVRIAMLDAICRMGDASPEAKAIVVGSMKSDDTRILVYAMRAMRHLHLRVDFGAVWRPASPLTTWSRYDTGFGPELSQMDGIAVVRPWKDLAWTKLSANLRLSLLARAGSREAVSLLSKAIETPDGQTPRPWRSWVPAEIVAPSYLRELLHHPRAEIRSLASFSLVMGKDREHLARLGRCLSAASENSGPTGDCPAGMTDEQVLRAAIPFFDRETLVALERRDPATWLWEVQNELTGRGEPFSYAELALRAEGLQPIRDLDPSRSYNDAERAAARYAGALKSQLFRAVARERRYDALAPVITRAIKNSHPFNDLRDLNNALWAAPEFLASLPSDVAHQNYLAVKQWIGGRKPERYVPHYDGTGICEALRTLGTLARGDDYEELWRDLRAAADPLEDMQRVIPVMWSFTERSEELRRLLASAQRQGWFQGGDNFYDLLAGTETNTAAFDLCAGRNRAASWDPFGAPSETLSFLTLKKALAADLEGIYPDHDAQALGRAFLELRSLGERSRDPVKALELLWDPREPIRVAANGLFKGSRPLGSFPPEERSSVSSRTWYAELRAKVQGFTFARSDLPGPRLDRDQQDFLKILIGRQKARFFEALVKGVHQSSKLFIACGGQPETKALVASPSSAFLLSTAIYQNELRDLLGSSDADLRQAAAWALWLRFREAPAVRVLLSDGTSSDLMTRAKALDALQTIRYPDAAPLFAPLLVDHAPELRQVGLRGVQAFGIRGALSEVENRVLDVNDAVAETAIEVLGALRPPEARPLLIRLLGSSDRLAWKASTALTEFRTTADIDALVARLVDESATERERWLILSVLTEITAHPSRQIWLSGSMSQPAATLETATIREWRDWWNRHREESAGARLRSNVTTLVEQFVKGDDRESTTASWSLNRLVPTLASYTTSHPPSVNEREAVEHWWRSARTGDPWTLLATTGGIVPETNLPLAMEVDARRTRQQLVAPLLQEFPVLSDFSAMSASHKTLVHYAGVDFGDPWAALCDARQKIVADWLDWAGNEGWSP